MKRFKKIYIEITNVCNLDCRFCLKSNREPKIMTVDEFEIILDKIKDYTDYIYLHVKGEPLLHPDLPKLLDICDSKGLKANITTNGTLLKSVSDILCNSKAVRQVNISMHALEAIKDYDQYLQEVINLIKNENRKFYLSLRFWLGNNPLKTKVIEDLKKSLAVNITNNQIDLYPKAFISHADEFVWPQESNSKKEFKMCYGIKDHIAILTDGTIVPCCLDGNGEINLGNIFTSSLAEIISSPRFQNMVKAFQTRKLEEPLCIKCSFKDRFA